LFLTIDNESEIIFLCMPSKLIVYCASPISNNHSIIIIISPPLVRPRSILGYLHPAPASRSAQIVTPSGPRASYTKFTETRSPLWNSFTPAVVRSTADMVSSLPLQHANTVYYLGDFSSLPDYLVSIRSRRKTPSIALSIAR
jgi:hypothetical protein